MSTDAFDVEPRRICVDDVPSVGNWVTVVDIDDRIAVLPARRRGTPAGPSVSVEERAFRATVRSMLGDVPIDLQTEHAPSDERAARFWRAFADYVRASERSDAPLLADPLLRRARFDAFVATALAVFPIATHGVELRGDQSMPAAVRRAIRYIEEHVQDGVPVEDVASAAGLSVRGLQAAFRRHLDRTPLEHLRLLRLQHAHDELVVADPTDGTTIEAVAARWGFSSSGRFAASYRQEYGVLPSVTLRR
jgi:AraC-like DNA-binding protein